MYILYWYHRLVKWYELRAIDRKFGSYLTDDNVKMVLNALVGRGKYREYILDKHSSNVFHAKWRFEHVTEIDTDITALMTYVYSHDLNELEYQRLLEYIIEGVGIRRDIRNYLLVTTDMCNILEVSKYLTYDEYKYGLLAENPLTGTTRWYFTNIRPRVLDEEYI